MATRVRLKRHRAIIIILSFPSLRVYLLFFFFFFFFLLIYSVLVARAAVTRFLFAHTHTIYHLSLSVFLAFSRDAPIIVPFITTHRRAPVFSFSFLSNLWLYEYILNNRLWYSLRYNGRISGEFLVFALDGDCDGDDDDDDDGDGISVMATVTVMVSVTVWQWRWSYRWRSRRCHSRWIIWRWRRWHRLWPLLRLMTWKRVYDL